MITTILDTVRAPLLQEAIASPKLLTDLAGLEKYIAESYSSRSFIELLQNADDALSTRILIRRIGSYIVVANNGRPFTAQDFESLCRSASSQKERSTNIGYRGIGFKSVVHFADIIHIFSGELETTFSRTLTRAVLPNAESVPLVRIPHHIDPHVKAELFSIIKALQNDDYNTIFVFSHLIAQFVESEFEGLDPTSILFLRNISEVIIESFVPTTISIQRETVDSFTVRANLNCSSSKMSWLVINAGNSSIAIQEHGKYINSQNLNEAVVHAFLPTSEPTGFGIKVNGDFSTDPSRLRIIYDEITLSTIQQLAKNYVDILEQYLSIKAPADCSKIKAMIPCFDPRMLAFQKKSFKSYFIEAIKVIAKDRLNNYFYKPKWINSNDFEILTCDLITTTISPLISDLDGMEAWLLYLGANPITIEMISPALCVHKISTQGAAEITSYIANQYSMKKLAAESISLDLKIWSVGKTIVSMNEALTLNKKLDRDFVDMITEKSVVSSELKRLIGAITDKIVAEKLFPPENITPAHTITKTSVMLGSDAPISLPNRPLSLIKWRSAEQQILNIFNSDGWLATDVSRQNIGYDIEAIDANGKKYYIEVKSISYAGQEFTFTSNEEATARDKGNSYIIALVLQQNEQLSVMLIENPTSNLKFERQCKQWVWLCSSYDFTPSNYKLE